MFLLYKRNKGDVSVLMTMFLMMAMTVVGISINSLVVKNLSNALKSKDSIEAFVYAEKGLEKKYSELKDSVNKAFVVSCAEKHADLLENGYFEGKPNKKTGNYNKADLKGENGQPCYGYINKNDNPVEGDEGYIYSYTIESQVSYKEDSDNPDEMIYEGDPNIYILKVNGFSENRRVARAVNVEIKFPRRVMVSHDIILVVDGTTGPELTKISSNAEDYMVEDEGKNNMRNKMNAFIFELLDKFQTDGYFENNRIKIVKQVGWSQTGDTGFVGIDRNAECGGDTDGDGINNNEFCPVSTLISSDERCDSGKTALDSNKDKACSQILINRYKTAWNGKWYNGFCPNPNPDYAGDDSSKSCFISEEDQSYINRYNYTTIVDENNTYLNENDAIDRKINTSLYDTRGKKDEFGDQIKTVIIKIDGGEYHQQPVLHEPSIFDFSNDWIYPLEENEQQESNVNFDYLRGWQNMGILQKQDGLGFEYMISNIFYVRFTLAGFLGNNQEDWHYVGESWYPYSYPYLVHNHYCDNSINLPNPDVSSNYEVTKADCKFFENPATGLINSKSSEKVEGRTLPNTTFSYSPLKDISDASFDSNNKDYSKVKDLIDNFYSYLRRSLFVETKEENDQGQEEE